MNTKALVEIGIIVLLSVRALPTYVAQLRGLNDMKG